MTNIKIVILIAHDIVPYETSIVSNELRRTRIVAYFEALSCHSPSRTAKMYAIHRD
jgi:hypothetical protein